VSWSNNSATTEGFADEPLQKLMLVIMKLSEILGSLGKFDSGSYILVTTSAPLTPDTDSKVVPIPEDPGADLGIPGFEYLIEVFEAKDVLETWAEWRNGRTPTPTEAVEAVLYYQANDTYLPTEEMKQQGFV
jgi:hypothetical protein